MSTGKILFRLVIAALIVIGIFSFINYRNVKKVREGVSEAQKESQARLVINQVKYAYTKALYDKNGAFPILDEVKNAFSSKSEYVNAIWEDNKIVCEKYEFECEVILEDNYFKVVCLDEETDMLQLEV